MKLPFADMSVVTSEKIQNYLLNEAHPTGRGKAEFFARLGFQRHEPEALRSALLRLAAMTEFEEVPSAFGRKYRRIGELFARSGLAVPVLTVWMLRDGEPPPMLVTAYPA